MISTGNQRLFKSVSVVTADGGFGITLDDKPLRTPARRALSVPSAPLAEAVAAEWDAQGSRIQPDTMPLMRLVSTAIDRVTEAVEPVADDLASYGGTDLLCYRAPHPEALIVRQSASWDGPLAWARDRHGAHLLCVSGVMHVAQPLEAVARLRRAVDAIVLQHGPLGLTALSELVTLSGSLVLGLAVAEGALEPQQAWAASRVDELYQVEQWGEDAEAAAASARREADFHRAATVLEWLRLP